jgi:hypothetical protein
MVLVIIVAVAWMVILGPSLMRRRSRTVGEIGSISHFHQQLRVLEHSAPQPIVAPAYRLRSVDGNDDPRWGPDSAGNTRAPVLTVVGADQLPRPALAFLGEPAAAGQPPAPHTIPPERMGNDLQADPGPQFDDLDRLDRLDRLDHVGRLETDDPHAGSGRTVDPLARQLVRRRRRDTLGVLAAVFVGTMMIGFVPGAGAIWMVTALSGIALAGYVALLVRLRRLSEEREQKLRYLRPAATGSIGADGVSGAPVTTSGRYAHPSNQAVLAR